MDYDYGNGELAGLTPFYKIWNALFQSISTRTCGYNSVNIALSSSAVLMLYLIMMFISSYPVATSVRSSTRKKFLTGPEALMRLIIKDLTVTGFMSLFLIIAQYQNFRTDPNFTIFGAMFEIVSAYGNVGLSLGYGSDVTSLSGRFNVVGKLIVIATMLLGRHRSLPESGDPALAGASESVTNLKDIQVEDTKK